MPTTNTASVHLLLAGLLCLACTEDQKVSLSKSASALSTTGSTDAPIEGQASPDQNTTSGQAFPLPTLPAAPDCTTTSEKEPPSGEISCKQGDCFRVTKKELGGCGRYPDRVLYWCPYGTNIGTQLDNCLPSGAAGVEAGIAGNGVCCAPRGGVKKP